MPDEITPPARSAGLDTVFMVTPVTNDKRMKLIAAKTTGLFIPFRYWALPAAGKNFPRGCRVVKKA